MTVVQRDLKPRMQGQFPVVVELLVADRHNNVLTVVPVRESRQYDPVYRVRLSYAVDRGVDSGLDDGSGDIVGGHVDGVALPSNVRQGDLACVASLVLEAFCLPPMPAELESVKHQMPHCPLNGSATRWLADKLLPKLAAWTVHTEAGAGGSSGVKDLLDDDLLPRSALSDRYYQLKQRHGQRLVDMWPRGTDPQKYVFEDIAIASFLLLLWEKVRVR